MSEKKQKPDSALDEVVREVEDAEKRTHEPDGKRAQRGEAGDALTPNTRAQEESEGE
ncbi:hypothetical protein ACFY94_04030 [Streptomyces griseorubiginosus]|uniref:hypothetical protein n=1 Tax=Streptomyces griseorubiginosus TaxID=67304 RepID=UPI0036E41A4A